MEGSNPPLATQALKSVEHKILGLFCIRRFAADAQYASD